MVRRPALFFLLAASLAAIAACSPGIDAVREAGERAAGEASRGDGRVEAPPAGKQEEKAWPAGTAVEDPGGEYFDAATGADLDGYSREQSEALDRTLDDANCYLDRANDAKFCDLDLCNAAAIDHIRPEQATHEVASPEYLAFEDLYNAIQAGYAERERTYEETYQKADELRQEFQSMHREYTSAVLAAYGN